LLEDRLGQPMLLQEVPEVQKSRDYPLDARGLGEVEGGRCQKNRRSAYASENTLGGAS
jgi:hypothetical protein